MNREIKDKQRICKYCKKIIKAPHSNSQKYHKDCFKEWRNEYQRRNAKENPERYKKYNQTYYTKNKANIKKRVNDWRDKNREKFREYNKKRIKKNEEKIRKYYRERARKLSKTPKYKKYAKIRNKSRYIKNKKDFCEICRSKEKIEKHHPDYSKPLEVKFLCHLCHVRVHYGK